MKFKVPSSDAAIATVLYFLAGTGATFFGIWRGSAYMTAIGPVLTLLSVGVWFRSKLSAILLIGVSIFFLLVAILAMLTGQFSWTLLARVGLPVYTIAVLREWLKGEQATDEG